MAEHGYLFVYGPLMRKVGGNWSGLLASLGDFVAEANVAGELYMKDWQACFVPGKRDEQPRVQGELWRLRDPRRALAVLDGYEGVDPSDPEGGVFLRRQVQVELDTDERVEAMVYAYAKTPQGLVRVESGIYREEFV